MLPPPRCFTCNLVLPFPEYEDLCLRRVACADAFAALGVARMCCRRMLMTHPPALEASLMSYPTLDTADPELFLDVRQRVAAPREVGCE